MVIEITHNSYQILWITVDLYKGRLGVSSLFPIETHFVFALTGDRNLYYMLIFCF